MTELHPYVDPELTFAVKTYFRSRFGRFYVREGVLVAFFSRLVDAAQEMGGGGLSGQEWASVAQQPTLLLLLSRTCLDLAESGSARYILLDRLPCYPTCTSANTH